MYCTKCGAELPDDAKVCSECGTVLKETKYCPFCGKEIDKDCVVCPQCGKQVGQLKQEQPQIVINNANNNTNTNNNNVTAAFKQMKECNKWVAFFLCLFLGFIGGHKFYEGKIGMGILYIFTCGLLGIGVLVDLVVILCKPNPYYV